MIFQTGPQLIREGHEVVHQCCELGAQTGEVLWFSVFVWITRVFVHAEATSGRSIRCDICR